jgi:anti-anti-sigma factor
MSPESPLILEAKACADEAVRVLALKGRLIESDGLQLLIAVAVELRAKPRCLVLDLSGLSEATTGGLPSLVIAQGKCNKVNCRMALVGAQGQVKKVLALSELDRTIEMAGTIEEAIEQP